MLAEKRATHAIDGIEKLESLSIGGVDQWIQIRGENKKNPLLLYLHGGPGWPTMAYAHIFQDQLEKHLL